MCDAWLHVYVKSDGERCGDTERPEPLPLALIAVLVVKANLQTAAKSPLGTVKAGLYPC